MELSYIIKIDVFRGLEFRNLFFHPKPQSIEVVNDGDFDYMAWSCKFSNKG
jgi:hypothetical protein